jgi:hypothetical protein
MRLASPSAGRIVASVKLAAQIDAPLLDVGRLFVEP